MSMREVRMIDLRGEPVELIIRRQAGGHKARVWINVGGICLLRAYECETLIVDDDRKGIPNEQS